MANFRRLFTTGPALLLLVLLISLSAGPAAASPAVDMRVVAAGFIRLPGGASDIGVGANGDAWIIGTSGAPSTPAGWQVYHWENGAWKAVPGNGIRIDVGPDGRPWVVNFRNEIYRWDGGRFIKLPGSARDIGVGADGPRG
jgi:hypothetical protein